jgi:hypothetical protein
VAASALSTLRAPAVRSRHAERQPGVRATRLIRKSYVETARRAGPFWKRSMSAACPGTRRGKGTAGDAGAARIEHRRRVPMFKGSAGVRPPASPPNSAADDSSHMWGATPCIKIGSASRLDLPIKVGTPVLPQIRDQGPLFGRSQTADNRTPVLRARDQLVSDAIAEAGRGAQSNQVTSAHSCGPTHVPQLRSGKRPDQKIVQI